MTNVEKLDQLGILGDIRKRLGAENEIDTSQDESINASSNDELMIHYTAWKLGHGSWWTLLKHFYDKLCTTK